jgi:prolipoprotein diacylglyceryltransferase
LGGWVGCLAAGCGYGKEVDTLANYPRWMTSELVDVFGIVAPRYNTPYFGIILCLIGCLLVFIITLWSRRSPVASLAGRRFWWILAFLSVGMFVIGFYRADHSYMVYGLRADQILDVIMGLWSLVLALRFWGQPRSERS